MKNIFLFWLFLCINSCVFSMDSAIKWSGILGGASIMLYAQSTWAQVNNHNATLNLLKIQLQTNWNSGPSKVQIGNNYLNNYDWQNKSKNNYYMYIINYFVCALEIDCGIRLHSLKELVEKEIIDIKYIHNPKNLYSIYKYNNGKPVNVSDNADLDHKSFSMRDFVGVDNDIDTETEEILKELEAVKNQILMPLFEGKKSPFPSYIMGSCGLGLFFLGCFYKKIFSLK